VLRPRGRIRAGGIERDVTLVELEDADRSAIDDACRSRYGRSPSSYVDPMEPVATAATLRLAPTGAAGGKGQP